MAGGKTLDTLSPELLLQILFDVESPIDLGRLILASPRFAGVFMLNKRQIMSAVARCQFHPAVHKDALTFAKISQRRLPLSRGTAIEFCHLHDDTKTEWQNVVTTTSESEALFELAKNVHYFVGTFKWDTLTVLHKVAQNPEHKVSTRNVMLAEEVVECMSKDLSTSETGRLQRAFCRFEIYRSLFASCAADFDHKRRWCARKPAVSPREQASLYLARFPAFEIEEINSVRDFLFRRLRGQLDRLEDHYYGNLSLQVFTFEPGEDEEMIMDDSGYYLFSQYGKTNHAEHLEHLMSLGLGYLRQIFQEFARSWGKPWRDLLIRHTYKGSMCHVHERTFITDALKSLPRKPASERVDFRDKSKRPWLSEVDTDSKLDIPDCWQWAHPEGSSDQFRGCRAYKVFRDFGYVFWDLERLLESGIMKHNALDIKKNRGFCEWSASDTPSVEMRLREKYGVPKVDHYANVSFDDESLEDESLNNESLDEDHHSNDTPLEGDTDNNSEASEKAIRTVAVRDNEDDATGKDPDSPATSISEDSMVIDGPQHNHQPAEASLKYDEMDDMSSLDQQIPASRTTSHNSADSEDGPESSADSDDQPMEDVVAGAQQETTTAQATSPGWGDAGMSRGSSASLHDQPMEDAVEEADQPIPAPQATSPDLADARTGCGSSANIYDHPIVDVPLRARSAENVFGKCSDKDGEIKTRRRRQTT